MFFPWKINVYPVVLRELRSVWGIHIPYTHIPYSMGGQLELQIEFPNHLMVADDVSADLH